ncbi:MAG: hypothetical protein B7X43_00995 [Thiomonas sp. 15-63-373]|jgi:hypothetical protein|nr:MAG: hypothetical protein B7X43_00995 [Thiomonas sp. 15-63-373]
MMTEIHNWLAQVSLLGWIAIASATVTAAFFWWSRANQPAFFDFLMSFPLRLWGPIGKLGRLKKTTTNLNERDGKWKYGMSPQEIELCSAYKDRIGVLPSPQVFRNNLEYLDVTGQGSVRPMPWWLWAILFGLTLGEAAGTGALLSEFVSTEVTATEQVFFTWGFAVFIAVSLLFLTHKAGTTYFERKTFKEILGTTDSEAKPHDYVDGTDDVGRGDDIDQTRDRGRSQPIRFYARLEKKKARGSMGWVIAVIAALAVLMVAVFGARMYGIAKQNTLEVTQISQNGVAGADGGGSNPFANMGDNSSAQAALPPDVAQAQAESRKKLAKEIGGDSMGQGLMAAIILTLFYVLVQMLGFAVSMKHAFFQKGHDAYEATRGCRSYEEMRAKYFAPYESRAEARLSELRSAYARVNESYSKSIPTTSFADFFHESSLDSESALARAKARHESQAAPVSAPVPAPVQSVAPAPTAQKSFESSVFNALALAEEIHGIDDKDQKKAWLENVLSRCTPEQRNELKSAMVQVKEARSKPDLSEFESLL